MRDAHRSLSEDLRLRVLQVDKEAFEFIVLGRIGWSLRGSSRSMSGALCELFFLGGSGAGIYQATR